MEPSVHVITLAVDDLQRALTFYRDGLGLPTKGVVADEYEGSDTEAAGAIVIFKLNGGLILSLYPRGELAKDARIPRTPPASGEFSVGHIVGERSEVDALLAQAQEAGATPTDEAHERPWGIYSGYFRDPGPTNTNVPGGASTASPSTSKVAFPSSTIYSSSWPDPASSCSLISVPSSPGV